MVHARSVSVRQRETERQFWLDTRCEIYGGVNNCIQKQDKCVCERFVPCPNEASEMGVCVCGWACEYDCVSGNCRPVELDATHTHGPATIITFSQ